MRARFTPSFIAPALALLIGCGDILYDQSQRALILEPVDRVRFEVDIGDVEVFAFDRNAVSLLYYFFGAESQIVDVGWELQDDEIRGYVECESLEGQRSCLADFYTEVPLGTAIVSRTTRGDLKLTGVDAPVEATVAGSVEGVLLAAPTLDLEVTGGPVCLQFAAPPELLRLSLDAGEVTLRLPPGPYRCDLDADDGDVTLDGVTCDDSAEPTLEVSVGAGNITLQPEETPCPTIE